MSKMIQKQIKRSMPVVLIFVLISSMVMGIVFNYDIRLTELPKELGSKVQLGFNLFEANAARNWATTTVTVRNAPPTTGFAAEVVASASTSPVNVGDSISFTATGDDPESQDYYLIVCSGGVTPRNGLPPICNGGTTFCVSGATTDNTPATCTYSPVAAGLPESQSWNAYACDAHATEADCSGADTGNPADETKSPFYVNHRPTLVDVSTTDNNKDPGQQVTITATTTDTDAGGGADWDTIVLSICSSNSWATSTGCAATTLCTATTTLTSGDQTPMSCNYTIPSPQMHGNTTYYAFIKDLHQLAASASDNSTYATNDVIPVLGEVYINGGSNIAPNIKGGTNTSASSSVQATDNNGCGDMTSASSTLYWSAVSGGAACTANNNDCYQLTTTNCSKLPGCTGAIADFVCSTTVAYLTNSTDNYGSNPRDPDTWLARITVFDGTWATSSISSAGVEVVSSRAVDITELSIPYGTIRSSFNSDTNNATTTVVNAGNTPVDTNVDGTDMFNGGNLLFVTEQKWSLVNFDYDLAGTALSSTTPALAAINVPKPTASDLSSPVYWGINIPAGKPSGAYTGTNTFTPIEWVAGW